MLAWRWILATIIVTGILCVFLVPMVFFVINILTQAMALIDPESNPLLRPGLPQKAARWVSERAAEFGVTLAIPEIIGQAKTALVRLSNEGVNGLRGVLTGTPEGLVRASLLIMTWLIFLVEGKAIRARFLPKIIPWPEERAIICDTTGDVLRAVILSNILVSLVQAIVVALFLWPTGTPQPMLWAGLAFFLSFVPLVGTAPIMIGAAIYAFTSDKAIAGVVLCVGAVVVGAVDNVLRPFFVKGGASLNFFWVFVAFIGGIAQFGLAGSVLGPLAFALFSAAARALEKNGAFARPAVEVDETDDSPPVTENR